MADEQRTDRRRDRPSPLRGQIVAGLLGLAIPTIAVAYESGYRGAAIEANEREIARVERELNSRIMSIEGRMDKLPATFPPVDIVVRLDRLERQVATVLRAVKKLRQDHEKRGMPR